MEFVKKYYPFLVGLGLIILYFITRFYNILSLPIFTDEAIYVRWSQIAANDASWRFISLTDGKQPMYVWIAMILLKFFHDPLFAGRLVSVIAGFGSLIGIFFLASEVFKNRKIGFIASLVYVLYPFSLVYDRLALYDSLVAMFIIWALFFEVLLVRRFRLDLALILGMILGAGMLTKTSNNFAFILLPFSVLLFDFKDKKWKENLRNWMIYAIVSVLIANVIYSVLRLSPYFHIIGDKNNVFVYPLREWIMHPFTFFWGNLRGLTGWIIDYATIPFLILISSAFLISKKFFREKLFLLVWFAVPFTALALFGKVIYPRFILFMTIPLLVLASYALYSLFNLSKKNYQKALVVVVFLIGFVINDFLILTNFPKAPIPLADKNQFLAGWPSGVGVKETVEFLEKQSINQKIYVGTEGTFGLMPYSLEIYLNKNPNIKIVGFWPINTPAPKEIYESAKKMPTYFVFYQPCHVCKQVGVAPASWSLVKVFQISKLEKDSYYTLYQVLPQ